jgi:geranylgeranyl diphosphate synthase type II
LDFKRQLEDKTQTVNKWLEQLAPRGSGIYSEIFDAANYSVNAGGKRIRPVLSLAVCELLGGSEQAVMPFACALEYIHTYSLIHDDLPCMDNDELRRGMPTCHVKHGEAMALLAGDALLTYAFEIISHAKVDGEVIAEAVRIISHSCGANGMIGGQVIDIKGTKSYEEQVELARMKTGALISAAAEIGVLASGNRDDNLKSAIMSYAQNLGIAFQIKDDLLDVEGIEAVIGKKTGHDAETGKRTFVTYLGIDGAREKLQDYTAHAVASIDVFGEKGFFLRNMAEYLLSRTK